ncbi:IclR family transcriptional regulator [Kordiimonas pumila]|uniref:IclR family transcriptional regulator n=1 Tax=Kordiimonas pumila TaxID=2161677 RepID=A0ABV7D6D0_9PROT|nr:IclR family transcriptional regulator [Kordiimonas pumila]
MNRDPRRRAPQLAPAKIETVATASDIIDFLAESGETVGVQKVADALNMTKSRASRHLANLESLGLIGRVPGARGYQLGWRVMRWGQIASTHLDLTKIFEGPLQDLNQQTNKTVLLCAPAGGEAIVTKCLPSNTAIRIEVKIGLVLSLPYSPSACICYAFLPREQRQSMLIHLKQREQDFRVENETHFNQRISEIQQTYYSWDKNKYNVGYGAIAAPVFNQHEGLAGTITLVLPSEELSDKPPEHLLKSLLTTAEECSRLLKSHIKFPSL